MTNLPASLKPTPEVVARDQELASEGNALLEELSRESGLRVRTNVETYNAVTFGPDGTPVARVRNGQPLQTREEEAVARAQAAANSEINRLERDLRDLINRRDEISGYDSDGSRLAPSSPSALRVRTKGRPSAAAVPQLSPPKEEGRARSAVALVLRSTKWSAGLIRLPDPQGRLAPALRARTTNPQLGQGYLRTSRLAHDTTRQRERGTVAGIGLQAAVCGKLEEERYAPLRGQAMLRVQPSPARESAQRAKISSLRACRKPAECLLGFLFGLSKGPSWCASNQPLQMPFRTDLPYQVGEEDQRKVSKLLRLLALRWRWWTGLESNLAINVLKSI